ncbi:recombinase family protein [Sinorhizobium meliloti]|nr:recombinase family protein [Sinorhizobium meliloti]
MNVDKQKFDKEQQVQDWLESIIAEDRLSEVIVGADKVHESLAWSESPEFKPPFPIDYLTRLGNLRAAQHVLGELHTLELVSKNNRSISREKGERLFVDLLYCARETSRFILFEIKNQDGSAREAVTEITAYEHEALNHTPFSIMMRQIMALFDEYQSKENAKHVLRAMNENARQGFWNGARPPIGYRVVAAEQRGSKIKKKLEIDPLHAESVRLIYRLFLEGGGTSGPKGVKAIATYLNERRMFTRDGGKWGLAQIHAILTRTTYVGEHRFNTRSFKNRERKPENEVSIMAVPPLIERETFDAVQARLKSRNPMLVPARVTSGPTLLTGICFCAKCGGAMTLRTGKGNGGQYTYYTCSTKARQGKVGCEGRSIRMDKLDHLVARHLEERLLQPRRLETILSSLLDRRQERAERRREHLADLNRRITETDQRLGRLYDAIETGVAALDDMGLKDRIANLKAIRDQAAADAERIRATLDSSGHRAVTPDMIDALSETARSSLRIEGGGYRRDHLRAFAQRVEVADDEVRIMGRKSDLLQSLVAASSGESAAFAVRSSVLKWRTRQDSNL